jgi:predicted lipid-binding transport protein (Tim44 family)
MMKTFVPVLALLLGAAILSEQAQAARLGGGRSVGVQRQSVAPQKPAATPSQPQAQPAAAQPADSRWLAPLAGLAAGLGLGWLFSHDGYGGAILMALLAGFAVLALVRMLARPRADTAQMRYAGLGSETVAAPPPSQLPGDAGAQPDYRSQFVSSIPAGFDVPGFLGEAKRNFTRLQDANDRGDLRRLREVTTGEMFEALKGDIAVRGKSQQTDVVRLDASLLEVVTEAGQHWASVRFSGSLREEAHAVAEPFEEIWHLQKPVDGSSGWLLAGIQQVS